MQSAQYLLQNIFFLNERGVVEINKIKLGSQLLSIFNFIHWFRNLICEIWFHHVMLTGAQGMVNQKAFKNSMQWLVPMSSYKLTGEHLFGA